MSFSETIFLFFLALIIFGPKKLPEIARQIGKVLNEFRRASNEFKSQIEQEIAHLEVEDPKKTMLPAASAPEGTASRSPGHSLSLAPMEASSGTESPATLAISNNGTPSGANTVEPSVGTEAPPSVDPVSTQETQQENHSESQQESRQESHA